MTPVLPWNDNLFDAVAEVTHDQPNHKAWSRTGVGYDIGLAALISALRQAPGPVESAILDRAVVLILRPDLVKQHLPASLRRKWALATRETEVDFEQIPMLRVYQNALNLGVMVATDAGLQAGPKLRKETDILDSCALVAWALMGHLGRLEQPK